MQPRASVLSAGVSLLVLAAATGASAQSAVEAPVPAATEDTTLGEIVVTARRRSESLQEVPQVVNAIPADTLQKLNIQRFQDIQTVVPGLTLQANATGYQASASLRGVSFDVVTSGQPTVALYLNDAPMQAAFLFQTMFDVGQIEVLRGPQGTTRGVSAPSGAITVTTKKPRLSEFGGYIDVTATDRQARNLNGAINVPLIQDVLAMRVAALVEENDGDGVRSINNPLRPRQVTEAVRASLSFEPSDLFNGGLTYTVLDRDLSSFNQVSGPGNATGNPAISPDQRLSAQANPNSIKMHMEVATAQIDSRIFGQHLSYVGSYQHQGITSFLSEDNGNVIPGIRTLQFNDLFQEQTSQEIRIASDPAPNRLFDYTAGVFYNWARTGGVVRRTATFLPGAFGSPAGPPNTATQDTRFITPLFVDVPKTQQETSFFGSLTLHLGSKTELSGGVRHIIAINNSAAILRTGNGLIARAPSTLGAPSCAAAGLPSTYAGYCDVTIPGGAIVQNLRLRTSERPTIYNLSLSHRFTRDLMAYASTGTAYRPPVASTGVFNATGDAVLNALILHPSEKSRSYEVGVKSTFLGGRAWVNLAAYRQTFDNLLVYAPGVPYISNNGTGPALATFNFTASVDAVVEGVDLDTAFQITRDWNIAAQVSYSDGRVSGGKLPCNDSNFDGTPDTGAVTSLAQFPAGVLVAQCAGGSVSRNPYWSGSVQSEYTRPISDKVNGFVRGLVSYSPKNADRVQPGFTVPAYSLVNLYAGVRAADGAWEVSLFARNAFNTEETTDLGRQQVNNATSTVARTFPSLVRNSGYFETTMTPRREVGVTARYAFGSR
ncbi:TonB-dependent receptor plug domain-containing protein [Phenylobacterium sp. LjRoot225]|uniref:TonB-dependent receptor n=1 Tax=Phenylobacterium sp. LjRoot225 TaxID=3342285 RepID=UPI003ECFE946